MKTTVVILLLALSQLAFAQQFLDEYMHPTSNKDAVYFRKTEVRDGIFAVKDYYVSNKQLAMEATMSSISPKGIHDGKCIRYFENGQLKEEGEYVAGDKVGLWKYYHENGKPSGENRFENEEQNYLQRWDESGTALLVKGTGIYLERSKDFGSSYRDIVNHKLRSIFSIDETTGDSIYVVVEKTVEYKGGLPALYRSMMKEIRYPVAAKRAGIQGKVFVAFVVDKSGRVTNAEVLRGIGGGCDEESIRVIKDKHHWNPGIVNGKPVKQKMVLPIAFKL
jgi:TonB family protein